MGDSWASLYSLVLQVECALLMKQAFLQSYFCENIGILAKTFKWKASALSKKKKKKEDLKKNKETQIPDSGRLSLQSSPSALHSLWALGAPSFGVRSQNAALLSGCAR